MPALNDLDRQFSRLVRAHAGWRCAYCGKIFQLDRSQLECSHFHSRRLKSVRFDPDNAEAMCFLCHQRLDAHPREYEEWKRRRLGDEKFESLRLRSQRVVKPDLSAIKEAISALAGKWGL
jgi:DNA-directed RNA polymerase subunit RPC12/RpoP